MELKPNNRDYRYDLATTLHGEQELEAAQKQLQEIVQRHPNDRRARVLLINYWKESGQLQNVQILLAQLEQMNPDDPALQQGPDRPAYRQYEPCFARAGAAPRSLRAIVPSAGKPALLVCEVHAQRPSHQKVERSLPPKGQVNR